MSPGPAKGDSPETIAALKEMWAASAQAVVQFLSKHPHATPKELATATQDFTKGGKKDDGGIETGVTALGPDLFLVSLTYASSTGSPPTVDLVGGTVFIVGLRKSKPALLWSIHDASAQPADRRGLLQSWQSEGAGNTCPRQDNSPCLPLNAVIGVLPADAAGRPRFYVDASYENGFVHHDKQTSVWRWEGDTARLLWIGEYYFVECDKTSTRYADGILSIVGKEESRTFSSCGMCEGRQMVQRLRVTGDGIKDLGKSPGTQRTVLLDLIDELFWRLAHGKPTAAIASPQVVRAIKPFVPKAKKNCGKVADDCPSVGGLMEDSVKHRGTQSRVCFYIDGLDDNNLGPYEFTILNASAKPRRILSVRKLSTSSCS